MTCPPTLIGLSTILTWVMHSLSVSIFLVSPEKRKDLDAEVEYTADSDIEVPFSSRWAFPCLLVTSDKVPRFCSNFPKVNKVTKPDSFPLPCMEVYIDQVGDPIS